MWTRGVAGPALAFRHIAKHTSLSRDLCTRSNGDVPANTRLSRQHTAVPDLSRSCNSNLRHNQAKSSYPNVVSYLDEIVDFRSGSNRRIVDRSAIDRRVRSDLDIVFNDASADVRNSRVLSAFENISEPVGSEDTSR